MPLSAEVISDDESGFVASLMRSSAEVVLDGGGRLLSASLMPLSAEGVLDDGPDSTSIVDFMLQIVKTKEADLVVMGSEKLSLMSADSKLLATQKGMPVGSLAGQVVKKITKPLFIFKAGSYVSDPTRWPRSKWLMSVHQSNFPLLNFVSKLLNHQKDELMLGRVSQMDQDDQALSSRLLERFEDEAVKVCLPTSVIHKRGTRGKRVHVGTELVKAANETKCDVLAVQVACHLEPSESVLTMLKTANCAVLIYKEKAEKKL
ncbi:hypothetical protein CYMTET_44239 [Cymbomonas tetramitiformis]|uniref:Uncharacterized protein n=1 Tax=Cymbomonas tetramitiformis TaxID=36881 RepID=A0AAE0EZ85_9CHLO|nr:hypothetical protein CYMTET_44239 [Cymbomonas tetramitiformis]